MKGSVKNRPKPKVAFANQAEAKENILTKMQIISSVLKPLTGTLVAVDGPRYETALAIRKHLPSTVRQFNKWRSDDLEDSIRQTLPVFNANANKTLHSTELFDDVARTVKAVVYELAPQVKSGRAERISAFKATADLAVRLRQISEGELIRLKRDLEVAKNEILTLNIKLDELRRRSK